MRLLLPFTLVFVLLGGTFAPTQAAPLTTLAAPVLKWQYGGCQAPPHYCDTGWYASPAVADLDGDGKAEVLWGGYTLFALNGEDGTTQWSAKNGSRIWPGVAVADLDGNGSLEVVVGRGSDQVTAYTSAGAVAWTRNPFGGGEVRSLAVADLEGDGQLEVIVGRASGGDTKQVNVFDAAGNQRPGWPARRDNEAGYGWGMYNENLAIADLDGNGSREIYAPTDTHYITALRPDGSQIAANPIYGAGKVWSQVGVHVDHAVDLRGYANCGTEHRPNFANVAPAAGDLDGNGTTELVVPGDVYNCDIGDPAGDLYYLPWILKADRTRWQNATYNWTVLPTPLPNSGPLSEDYTVIENIAVNTVLADLDGDGVSEILFPSYDGRLHAYWLDKTEHASWPFDVPGSGIRFASEPTVVDLNNDGQAEVIFTSWPEKQSGQVGQLHVLSADGVQLYAVNLPAPGAGSATWNGALGAPTVANIDADPDLEVVVGTAHSGAVAYDLPGTATARVLWGTGRGSYQRTGVAPTPPPFFQLTSPQPNLVTPAADSLTFTVTVTGFVGQANLSLSAPRGPTPLPAVSLSSTTLQAPGSVTITMTAPITPAAFSSGAVYAVDLLADNGRITRTMTLRAFIDGKRTFLPLTRR